ncbi:Bro-N domain-containing protein [Pseudomonas sp. SLFW]|uniref:BRO-N domain-containing protein n=1 Tax=Pseudomonas sp. SLFW TaxID=2683259 RepID=UPI001413487D|nr:Bro-N domain-containing protein [Pseudomonas sp. SLFW]NBB12531.1 phage antirepressor protein [Pseudomonas sp. SLFW]
MPTALHPTTFHRHNRPLRTFLLESEVWFCARDLGRLMGWPLNERATRKLDVDQRRTVALADDVDEKEVLVVSESAVYALLTYHYRGENRALRRWNTHDVVPCLWDKTVPSAACYPCESFLQWPGLSVSMLRWESEPWIRLRDMPQVLAVDEMRVAPASRSRVRLGGEWRFRCFDGDEMSVAKPFALRRAPDATRSNPCTSHS